MCKITNSVNWCKIVSKIVRISKGVLQTVVCTFWVAVFYVDYLEKMKHKRPNPQKAKLPIEIVFLVWS